MTKNLVIVESPAKAKTIEKFLGKDFTVKSSNGHIRDLAKKDLGIDISNNFEPNYIVSADKKNIVSELKKLAKQAEVVWLASDEDREGEAISWHLAEELKLSKEKTKRIVFNEITKNAILKAIENPRDIDKSLVDAQQARRILDRLVGFELSPILWKKVKPSLSAGRVQSVAVRLIVEREKEINLFNEESYYKISAVFTDGKSSFKSEIANKFANKESANEFLELCKNAKFTVSEISKKPGKKSPAPPFTTSTLQQEAARKLGMSVSQTMRIAQQLYESGLITYMRTDSLNLSDFAISASKKEISSRFGSEYSKTRKFTTKTKGAQEAHEAIRPTYFENSEIDGDKSQQKLYDLIWKRTIASQMSDAQIEKTVIKINISTNSGFEFISTGEVITFDGFLKVYIESTDDIDESDETQKGLLPNLKVNTELNYEIIQALQKFTSPPARYTEASLVRKLEELGIGRPSTYAPTISTIQKRTYIVKEERPGRERNCLNLFLSKKGEITNENKSEITGHEKNKLFPTDIGIVVNDFLVTYFEQILDYNFTAKVENRFDEIALGDIKWKEMISEFYETFHKTVINTSENSEKASGERSIGVHPESGKPIIVRIGRFGPMVQIGDSSDEEKPLFASLKKGQSLQSITLDEALELFKYPKIVGELEGKNITVAIGRFGPYVKHDNKFISIPKDTDISEVTEEIAIDLISLHRKKEAEKFISEFEYENDLIQILNGRWGPYISYKKSNYKILKTIDPSKLNLDDCLKIINTPQKKPKKK